MNLLANEVVHIGDSLSSDVEGAKRLGINTIWINGKQMDIPEGALVTVTNLLEVFKKEIIKGGYDENNKKESSYSSFTTYINDTNRLFYKIVRRNISSDFPF